MRLLALVLAGCASDPDPGTSPDDGTAGDADADADADSDTDADADADSDADADTATPPIGGCAVDRWDPADFATVIDVGPAHAAATPSDVPWESIGADTLVRIWSNGSAYHDKWAIDAAGTEADPIVVIGVCDPATGALPVIDGDGATTRAALDFWSETRGVLKIGGTNTGDGVVPAWIYVEDLELRAGRSPNPFTDESGAQDQYDDNAAAVFVEEGRDVTIRGCTLTDSGNGLFAAHETTDLTVSSNWIHDNGNPGSIFEHNNYTEANGIVFEYNHFGPPCAGCGGNNLKDRSAGTVIRYNWIEGGNRQLDLVESDYADIRNDPSYRETFVYGNVLVEHADDGNSQIAHYGGDGAEANFRRGTLYFYGNTVVSEDPGNTTLVRLSDPNEVAEVRNNVLYADGTLAILELQGTARLSTNWLVQGWRDSHEGGGFEGTVEDGGGNQVGADPGFTDRAAHDLTLAAGAAPVDAGGALAPGALALDRQYVVHQDGEPRPVVGAVDQGAFERP